MQASVIVWKDRHHVSVSQAFIETRMYKKVQFKNGLIYYVICYDVEHLTRLHRDSFDFFSAVYKMWINYPFGDERLGFQFPLLQAVS